MPADLKVACLVEGPFDQVVMYRAVVPYRFSDVQGAVRAGREAFDDFRDGGEGAFQLNQVHGMNDVQGDLGGDFWKGVMPILFSILRSSLRLIRVGGQSFDGIEAVLNGFPVG